MANHPASIVRVTWIATYKKVFAATGDDEQAIFEAERAVRRAHGSSASRDWYDTQIIVDHFNGKITADDPKLKQQLQLLKQQAEDDWIEIYSGKKTLATPENIAEDYIGNAKLTARTQRILKRIKLIALLSVVLLGALVYAMKSGLLRS